MPPTTTKKDDLVGKQVRSKASSIIGKVTERIDHEHQYRVEWKDQDGNKAEATFEASDVEAI